MTKKYIVLILAAITILFLLFARVYAKERAPFIIESNILIGSCDHSQYGCYWEGTNIIAIKEGMTKNLRSYVLNHELSHFYLDGTTESQYEAVLGVTGESRILKEYGAVMMHLWMIYPESNLINNTMKNYFNKVFFKI